MENILLMRKDLRKRLCGKHFVDAERLAEKVVETRLKPVVSKLLGFFHNVFRKIFPHHKHLSTTFSANLSARQTFVHNFFRKSFRTTNICPQLFPHQQNVFHNLFRKSFRINKMFSTSFSANLSASTKGFPQAFPQIFPHQQTFVHNLFRKSFRISKSLSIDLPAPTKVCPQLFPQFFPHQQK